MRRLCNIFGLLLLATCGWARDAADFNGRYVWSGNTNEAAAVAREVDAAAHALIFFLRPIARPRLARSIAPYAMIDFAMGASNAVVFTRTGEPPIHGVIGGEPVKWESEEGTIQNVTFVLTADGKLQQTFNETDGARVNCFALAPGGTNLILDVTVSSKRLGHVIRYSLTYFKQRTIQ